MVEYQWAAGNQWWNHGALKESVSPAWLVASGEGLNFDPIEFRPVGSWFNWLCSGFKGFFILKCDPPRQGVIVLRPLWRIKFGPPLNCDLGSCFHVELWPQVLIPRWILTPSHDSTLNCDPGFGSHFNVEFWPGVIIQRRILIRGYNSTLNYDPRSWFNVKLLPEVWIQRWIVTPIHDSTLNSDLELGSKFNVEFWPGVIIQRGTLTWGHNLTSNSEPSAYLLCVELRLKKVSKFNSVIKIQQLRRVIIQRKIHWILTPGRYSMRGSKFYLTPPL